jgi:hypothetical protein
MGRTVFDPVLDRFVSYPDLIITDTVSVATRAAMLALTSTQNGDVVIVAADEGNNNNPACYIALNDDATKDINDYALVPSAFDYITLTEAQQLANINATTISSTQWGYLGGLDQSLAQASSVQFTSFILLEILVLMLNRILL